MLGFILQMPAKEIVEDRKQIVFERVSAMLDKLARKDAAELIRIVKKLLP